MSADNVTLKSRGRARKIVTVVVIGMFLILGIGSILGGAIILYFNMGTDKEGYAVSEAYPVRTSANAFALWVAPMRLTSTFSWLGQDNIVQTKWIITAANPNKEIFAGWVRASTIESYLANLKYETPNQAWTWYIRPYYAEIEISSTAIYNQGSPPRPPAQESFWLKSVVTSNSSTMYWNPVWDPNTGMNVFIVMNADGSSNVSANVQLGFKVPILGWLPYLLIPLGIILCIIGILLLKRSRRLVVRAPLLSPADSSGVNA